MLKHNWSKYQVALRTKTVLETELKVTTKRELVKVLRKDITVLWRIPQCGIEVIKEILKIAFN